MQGLSMAMAVSGESTAKIRAAAHKAKRRVTERI
jgi:hypothetical protein